MTDALPNLHRRRLGQALRGLREAAGLSLTEASELLSMAKSALSKIENGKQRVPMVSLPGYFEAYGCTDTPQAAKVREIATMASRGKRSNLLDQYREVVRDEFAQYLNMEELASTIDSYCWIVPGLLQTEDYARALIERHHRGRTRQELDAAVDLKMTRQEALLRDKPLHLWCVLDEAVVRRQIGGDKVMREQLKKLLRIPEDHANVAIQVLPFTTGVNAGLDGPFHVLHFPAGPPIVVVEPMTTSVYLEEEKDVERYQTAYNYLRSEALDAERSQQFIHNVIKESS